MSITVIKEGSSLRVLEASEEIPDGTRLTLFTEQELASAEERRRAGLAAQMPSFIRGDEHEEGESLFDSPSALRESPSAEERAFEQVGLADWAADPADRQVDWEAFFHLEPTKP